MGFLENIRSKLLSKEVVGFNASDKGVAVFDSKLPVHPEWFFTARLGQPRGINIQEVREFAKSPWVQMVMNTIKKEVGNIPYEIVNSDPDDENTYDEEKKALKKFLGKVNSDWETIVDLSCSVMTDIAEIDSGIWIKVYSQDSYDNKEVAMLDEWGNPSGTEKRLVLKPFGQRTLVELRIADSATFLKQIDIYRRIQGYYQYSFKSPTKIPIRFDPDEVIYFLMNKRPQSIYGFCMPWDSTVETSTGKELIGEIVSQKKDVLIKTYNEETKTFEFKKIKGYYSRYYNKPLYKIAFADGDKNYNIRCTAEHPILTTKGFVPAEEITLKDSVIVRGVNVTAEQRAFIMGTLLGDANLTCKRKKGYPYFQVTHSEKEKYYVDWAEQSLGVLDLRRNEGIHPSPHYPDRLFKHSTIASKIQPCLDSIRRLTYPEHKKLITKEWVDELTPLSIAAWMMDDGSVCKYKDNMTGFTFCTDSFSKEECNLLIGYFEKQDIEVKIMCPPSTGLNRLWLNKTETMKLLDLVKDYFVVEDNKKTWVAEILSSDLEETGIPIPITNIGFTNKEGMQVFDIEVEDNHNFINNRAVVHNSPVQAVQQVLETLIQSTRYNKDFFKNNAIPDGIIGLPNANPESMKMFKEMWQTEFKGKPHKLLYHNTDAKFESFRTNHRDMEWLEGQKWYFHLVFGVFGVSPVEAGFHENVNQGNQAGQERVTVKNAIKPYLTLLENNINRFVLTEFFQDEEPKLKFEFQPEDHSQEGIQFEQAMREIEAGTLTVNEYRLERGREVVDWGDTPSSQPDEQFGETPEDDLFGDDKKDGKDKPVKPNDDKEAQKDKENSKKTVYYKKAFERFVADGNC